MLDILLNPLIELIINGLVTLALISLYFVIKTEFKNKNNLIEGTGIGIILIIVMLVSSEFTQGIIFDARNVVLSIGSFFFGPIPTLIGTGFALVYRLFVGGDGMLLGVIEIIVSSGIGLLGYYFMKIKKKEPKAIDFLILGFIVHLFSFSLVYFSPTKLDINMTSLIIPYLIVYPLYTVLVTMLIKKLYNFKKLIDENTSQRILLDATINATKTTEIYTLDCEYQYITFNDFHQNQMEYFYLKKIEKGESIFSYIGNNGMIKRLKQSYDIALNGVEHQNIYEIEVTPGKYVEETFSPIINDNKIIGVSVFSVDVTDKVNYRKNLEYLSFNDPLTGLKNRRYFEDFLKTHENYEDLISVMYLDINGLKVMNDTFGHEEGDRLIVRVSEKIRLEAGLDDEVCRIGGDEFVMFLKNLNYEAAIDIADRIKESVKDIKIKNIRGSVSYGVSTNQGKTMKEMIVKAENRMNRNKLIEKTSHRSTNIPQIIEALSLSNILDKDHSTRVKEYVKLISEELKLSETMMGLLMMLADLHDIGKIGIDQNILNKQEELTKEEFEELKRHTLIGFQLLSQTPEYTEIAQDVLSHHERYDGTGYPQGIKGKDIPFRARVISVANSYDEMINGRPYRKAISVEEAKNELINKKGKKFDPLIVDAFIEALSKNKE